ncbi:MAG: LysE family translocator [Cocleimonas sp.]|nr:LysE family translocator [Cocleimonas sp.]
MHDYLFFIPIAIALGVGVISPGPSFIFVAQTAMQKSRAHGIATSLGMGTGALIYSLVAIMGLFVVLQTVPTLYLILKIIGGLYLFYIAYLMWKSANNPLEKATQDQSSTNQHGSLGKAYVLGLFTQLSNPKTAIVIGGIFMAFLPEKIPDYSIPLLSMMAFIIDAGWYMIVTIALSTSKAQNIYTRFKKIINRFASGLMGLLGLKLIFNQ